MPDFNADLRDLKFCLFEQCGVVDKLLSLEAFSDFSQEDIEAVLEEGYRIAKEVFFPLNASSDAEGAVWRESGVTMPEGFKKAWDVMVENQFLAMSSNPEFGGVGLPMSVTHAVNEVFVGANPSLSLTPLLTVGAAHLIEVFGSDELKKTYVENMYTGRWAGTMCLTEPHAGTDVGALKTKAYPQDDGSFLIEGTKIFISSGDHDLTENIIHAVLARVEGDSLGTKGISLFAVPKFRLKDDSSPGEPNDVKCVGVEHKMGINGSPTCVMAFGENGACQGWLIGEQGQGMRNMFQMMNEARIGVGLQGAASANAAYQLALAYAKDRTQGPHVSRFRDPTAPRVPIIEHPDVRRMLMLQKAYAEGTRALVLTTSVQADLIHHGADEKTRKEADAYVQILTPIVKAYCTDYGFKVTEWAMQTHGGYGYLKEYGVEQMMRDVKIASIYEGTNGIQAMDLVGRKISMNMGADLNFVMRQVNEFIDAFQDHKRLRREFELLTAARDAVNDVSMHFAMLGQNDPTVPLMNAYPYLELFGDLIMAKLLLEQAVIASDRFESITAAKKVNPKRKKELRALLGDDEEAAYYHAKVKTAQFFCNYVLPLAPGKAAAVRSGDKSALEVRL